MLESLISSKTRVKILQKFFLNPESSAYLRGLEAEFGESTNAIRLELNRFEDAGMLRSFSKGNRKLFKANIAHPLFKELRSIVMKHFGLDQLIDTVVSRLGDLKQVYLSGDLAQGMNSDVIDLVFVGNPDTTYLVELIDKAEAIAERKIRYLIYTEQEAAQRTFDKESFLLVWDEGVIAE